MSQWQVPHARPTRKGAEPAKLRSAKDVLRVRGGKSEMSIFGSNLFPIVGLFTSNALYFSPIPAVLERLKEGSLGSLNPIPTACILLSTIAWLMYAFSVPNPWVVASNLPGACAAIAAMTMTLPLMKVPSNRFKRATHQTAHAQHIKNSPDSLPHVCYQGSKQLLAVQSTLVGGTLINLSLWSYLIFSGMAPAARSRMLGLYASAFFIILAASPLSTIQKVVATKDSASIYAPMTVAQCVNSGLWSVYGFFGAKDVFVWGPNVTGLGLGLLQLLLKLVFPSSSEAA